MLALRDMLKLSARPVLGVELALAKPLKWAMCSNDGTGTGLSAKLLRGLKLLLSGSSSVGAPKPLSWATRSTERRGMGRSARLCLGVLGRPMPPDPKPPLRLVNTGRPKEAPKEVDSTSIGDSPRDDLGLGDPMLGLAGGSAAEF